MVPGHCIWRSSTKPAGGAAEAQVTVNEVVVVPLEPLSLSGTLIATEAGGKVVAPVGRWCKLRRGGWAVRIVRSKVGDIVPVVVVGKGTKKVKLIEELGTAQNHVGVQGARAVASSRVSRVAAPGTCSSTRPATTAAGRAPPAPIS